MLKRLFLIGWMMVVGWGMWAAMPTKTLPIVYVNTDNNRSIFGLYRFYFTGISLVRHKECTASMYHQGARELHMEGLREETL